MYIAVIDWLIGGKADGQARFPIQKAHAEACPSALGFGLVVRNYYLYPTDFQDEFEAHT